MSYRITIVAGAVGWTAGERARRAAVTSPRSRHCRPHAPPPRTLPRNCGHTAGLRPTLKPEAHDCCHVTDETSLLT